MHCVLAVKPPGPTHEYVNGEIPVPGSTVAQSCDEPPVQTVSELTLTTGVVENEPRPKSLRAAVSDCDSRVSNRNLAKQGTLPPRRVPRSRAPSKKLNGSKS